MGRDNDALTGTLCVQVLALSWKARKKNVPLQPCNWLKILSNVSFSSEWYRLPTVSMASGFAVVHYF